jgi:hypothetical protein
MLHYLPIEIVNHILTFRPPHPSAVLIKHNLDECLKNYLDNDYDDRYELYEEDEINDIITNVCKQNLRRVSNYRRALEFNKTYFENQIKNYSNEHNYKDAYFWDWEHGYVRIGSEHIDYIDYEYIEICKNKLKTIDILIKKFTLYKDIEQLYNFDHTYFENIGYDIVEHVIEKYNSN